MYLHFSPYESSLPHIDKYIANDDAHRYAQVITCLIYIPFTRCSSAHSKKIVLFENLKHRLNLKEEVHWRQLYKIFPMARNCFALKNYVIDGASFTGSTPRGCRESHLEHLGTPRFGAAREQKVGTC